MASSDSDEEYSQVEQPITHWSAPSIVERVGLNTMQMSEEEVESAFCQITLAFRTDQYTLKQRLQAEEHARDLAEENVQQELSRGRETLESLKGLCLDMRRSAILQRLELSLDILGGTVERISTAAEVLGSVHQEVRVCRAVEIMVAHVENLKRRHDRDGVELEQTKRLVHRVSRRNLTDPGVQPADVHEMELQKQSFQHFHGRRRVSASIITKESQDKRRRELKRPASLGDARCPSPTFSSESSCSFLTRDDTGSLDGRLLVEADTPLEASVAQPVPDPSLAPNPESPPPPPPEASTKTRSKSFQLDTLRQRHRGKAALSKRKSDRNKKAMNRLRSSLSLPSAAWRPFPLTCWLFHPRWGVLYVSLFLILSATMLSLFS